jgi:hypothetical protein
MQTRLPSTTRLDEPALLRLRIWATSLRDEGLPELTSQCRTLVQLIDVRSRLTARNAVECVDRSIRVLADHLVERGAGSPW